jgi:hypothetical protein
MSTNTQFAKTLFLTCVLLILAISGIHMFTAKISFNVACVLSAVVLGYAVIAYLLHVNILKSNAKSPTRFVTAFTGGIAIKLFASVIFLAIYMYLKCEKPVLVALVTFCIYIVFNILLISSLLKVVSKK